MNTYTITTRTTATGALTDIYKTTENGAKLATVRIDEDGSTFTLHTDNVNKSLIPVTEITTREEGNSLATAALAARGWTPTN